MKKSVLLFSIVSANYSFANTPELDDLSFESLLATDVQVTSAMKRTQEAKETAASVYVISQQTIKNSGVSSVAQALALAPGMQVRQIDNNKWAIGIRNPSGRYTSKLLVMIDGQSIYNPSLAGVYWEALDIPVYDIERIEITRGQGGLLWGSNATNGVVNIITKHSIDTRGAYLTAKAGNHIDHDVSIRLGGDVDIGNLLSYRFYAKKQKTVASDQSLKWTARDNGEKSSVGGRVDLAINDDTSLLLQADYTDITIGQTLELVSFTTHEGIEFLDDEKRTHGQIMFRIDHRLSDTANQMLQMSLSKQNGYQPYYKERFRHYDIDYQVNMLMGETQFDFGLNYRYNKTPFTKSDFIEPVNQVEFIKQYGGFLQANFELVPEQINLTIGNRSEHNSLTGWEHQPSVRFTLDVDEKQFFWASISQGIRVPTLTEVDFDTKVNGAKVSDIITTNIPSIDNLRIESYLRSNKNIESEKIISAEMGYRIDESNWNFDLSLFYATSNNALNYSVDVNPELFPMLAQLLFIQGDVASAVEVINQQSIDLNLVSTLKAESLGSEVVINWSVHNNLNLQLGYSFTTFRHTEDFSTNLTLSGKLEQLSLTMSTSPAKNHSLFSHLRWESGELYLTDSYAIFDINWRWQINNNIALSLEGKNLLERSHLAYARTNETFSVPTYIDRRIALGISIGF